MNPGIELDLGLLDDVNINLSAIIERAASLEKKINNLNGIHRVAWLIKAITCMDLTTLGGDDTCSNVKRLCLKATQPLSKELLQKLDLEESNKIQIRTAAVCVYPSRVQDAYSTLKNMQLSECVPVAAVATGFPSGQFPLQTRLDEMKYAIENGASEIDIVLDRSLVLRHDWQTLYEEIRQMRYICGKTVHMKAILSIGELGSFTNIYKASLIAMMAGSDFIKTSTGKESVNATLPVGILMCRAICKYYSLTGYKVGLKPAGGIRTSNDAIKWLILIKEELGNEWLNSQLFRIGASGLLTDLEKELYFFAFKKYPNINELTLC